MPYTSQDVGFQKTDTSYEAAQDVSSRAQADRDAVYALLLERGYPMTTEEISAAIGRCIQPRTSDLSKADLICDSGERGKTKLGRSCIKWVIGKAKDKPKVKSEPELFPEIFGGNHISR